LNQRGKVSVKQTPSATDAQACIEVRNQGPTIAPERLATLFELGTSDAGSQQQRGQGLFVARGYLAKMGGAIAVRNELDGVCFSLTLPR
jgi:sensor histidine kinase regulating citrate/malate metabolism